MTPRVRLTVCDAGPFTLDRSDLMVGATGPLTVPSTVVVIEHPSHGLVLFDRGSTIASPTTRAVTSSGVPASGSVRAQPCSRVSTRWTHSWNAWGTGAPT